MTRSPYKLNPRRLQLVDVLKIGFIPNRHFRKVPQIRLVDAQFLELGKFNEAQNCGMFGVPLMLVQAGDNPTTYASATEFKRTFVDMTLAPIFVNFESAADRDCLTSIEQDRYYAKFNLNALLRGNIVERFGAYAVGITNKFMSSNEARALEDWNPREGGDVYENPNTSTNTSSTQNNNSPATEKGVSNDKS